MLPMELKCLYCTHCTIEQTGDITCPAYQDSVVPAETVLHGLLENCGGLRFQRLHDTALVRRMDYLKKTA